MRCLVLDFHASYCCRHSGACCTSGWPIPIEAPLALGLRRSLASGELRLEARDPRLSVEPLEAPAGLPADIGAITRCDAAGACAFYERGSGLCAIHAQLGPGHLPASCAHFPRVCLIDEDATYVTLSHYCPTAAGLLFDPWGAGGRGQAPSPRNGAGRVGVAPGSDGGAAGVVADLAFAPGPPPAIVAAPPALLAGIRVEGLDARGQLPPLLRPGMLGDRASYRRWERFVVEELADGPGTVEARLARAASVTDRVCEWSPADGQSLEQHLEGCIDERLSRHGAGLPSTSLRPRKSRFDRGIRLSGSASAISELYDYVRSSCPGALAPAAASPDLEHCLGRLVNPEWEAWSPVVGRYLAAKVFGSWLTYQGRGLRTVLAGVCAALAVLRVEAARQCDASGRRLDAALLEEAIRQADLLLVHLADRQRLADRLNVTT